MEYLVVFYLLCYNANAQFTLDNVWGRSFARSSNLDMNGSGTQGTFFTVVKQPGGQVHTETRVEVSSNGIPQGSFDPVNAVKQAMSQASLDINPLRIPAQQISSDPGIFNGHNIMQSMQQARGDQSASSMGFGSMGPMQSFQHMTSSHSSFSSDSNSMQPLQSRRQTVSHTSVNMDKRIDPVQSVQHSFFKSSASMPAFRNNQVMSSGSNTNHFDNNVIQTEQQNRASNTFPNTNRFSNVRKGSFGPAIARVPGAFDLAVTGITVKTAAPPNNSITSKAPSTISPNLKQVAKEIIESNRGKGIEYPKPLCIELPDPVYNTLCLMRTDEANRVSEMEIVTEKPNTQKETIKETFTKAADLVSLVAQGLCAFCCQATGGEKDRCIKMFCETKPTC